MSHQPTPIRTRDLVNVRHSERGMTTAEYAVGVIAVIAAIAVLIAVIKGGPFAAAINDLVLQVIRAITDAVK